MVLFSAQLSEMLGFPHPAIAIALGAGVFLFGAHIAFGARRAQLELRELKFFTLMDGLWVIGSLVFALSFPLSTSGLWLVLGAALIVTDFGILEWIGIQSFPRLNRLPS